MYDNQNPNLNNEALKNHNGINDTSNQPGASVNHEFILVDAAQKESAQSQGNANVDAQGQSTALDEEAHNQSPSGVFSGQSYNQPQSGAPSYQAGNQGYYNDYQPRTENTDRPYSAKDIQPRGKMGWGKRIAVLILCGLLLGSSTAGAYFGVTYLIDRFAPEKETSFLPEQDMIKESAEPKLPEISQVETIVPGDFPNGAQSGSVGVGVAYDVSPVVENVMPAMVSIINKYTQTVNSFFGQSYTQPGASSGSGIIIGENETELLIATNYHVIEGSDSIEITFIDGAVGEAFIKGTNPDMDLAVVSVALDSLSPETKTAIAVAQLGNSDGLKLGQPVIAIGNALGYGQSVTTGVVSAVDRQIAVEEGADAGSFIQTDAAINPGNSGGALLNMSGEVIGINSNKIGGSAIEGMGYAIPISAAQPIISDLSLQTTKVKVEEAKRGYLGVSIAEVTASDTQRYGMPQGVYIGEFTENSAAKAGGMKLRDIVVGFDTFKVQSYADLQEAMQYFEAGSTVSVEVKRMQDGEYVSVFLEITLGERPAE